MRLGTDVCLKECRREGYLMMDYKKRELIIKGELQKDANVRFLKHFPDYVLHHYVGEVTIMMDIVLSANDVWKSYLENRESIDSFVGDTHEFPTCEGSLLSLANDVDGYKNLE